ncbi:MAG: recombinase zinc beta ribbon domain-containing protein, partial [Hyphomicrobium sp.]
YIGEFVFNRQSFVKDPATGRRVARSNPESDWLVQPMPELVIIDRATFDAAQVRRAEKSQGPLVHRRRPKHLLSGLAACGVCGAPLIVKSGQSLGCSRRANKGTCENRRTIRLEEIEERVLAALQDHLLAPEIVRVAVEAYRERRAHRATERAKEAGAAKRELSAIDAKIGRLVRAIEEAGDAKALSQRLNARAAARGN